MPNYYFTAPSQPFHLCHLQILRSLYATNDRNNKQSDAEKSNILDHHRRTFSICTSENTNGNGCSGDDKHGKDKLDDSDITEENNLSQSAPEPEDVPRRNAEKIHVHDSENPVGDEMWDLIERFLHLRAQYRPHKERQLHWSKIYAESNSRLSSLVATTSSYISNSKQDGHIPLTSKSSATPRTPIFFFNHGHSGSNTVQTPSLSLTPVSSNRNTTSKLKNDDERHGELVTTLPAWNFIHQMLHRHSKRSMQSCTMFRSQLLLATLQKEAELRCDWLQNTIKFSVALQHQQQYIYFGKRNGLTQHMHVDKRRKLESMTYSEPTTFTLGNFILSEKFIDGPGSYCDIDAYSDEDYITCAKMKLQLWKSLLSSVAEIVDEDLSTDK